MRAARVIELSAWIAGMALLGAYAAARVSLEAARTAGVEAFRASGHVTGPANVASLPAVDQSLWSPQRIDAYQASVPNAGTPLGVLRIPALALEVPIRPGTSAANLNRGAAHIDGTAELDGHGNIGLASHRDGFFRSLKDVAIDDELVLELAGRERVFRVVELAVVSPGATTVLAPTPVPSVTLVTCYPFYFVGDAPQRYIVRAKLHEPAIAGPRSKPDVISTASERVIP